MRRYLTDPRLLLFGALILGASIISSHGAWLFFGYLVAPWLAGVFTAVVAVGIIGLDAAGTVERGWRRAPYYAGMAFFILLETLANYFAGQAGFVTQIREALHDRPASDLLAIATQDPTATRSLVWLFLSPASLAVALFVFAATKRVMQIRAGDDRPLAARIARLVGALRRARGRVSRLVGALRETRAQLRATRGELAALAGQARDLADRGERLAGVVRRARGRVRRLVGALQDVREDLVAASSMLADLYEDLADERRMLADERDRRARTSRVLAHRRGLVRRLVGEVRIVRGMCERQIAELAERDRIVAVLEDQAASVSRVVTAARGRLSEVEGQLADERAAHEASAREAAELREQLRAAVPTRAAVVAYAQAQVNAGRALDEVARSLGFPASTLRTWGVEVADRRMEVAA